MTTTPTPTEKSKKQRDNTKTPTITQRLRTDLGRSVGVTTATQLVWLNRCTISQPSHTNRKSCVIKRTYIWKFVNNPPYKDRGPSANQSREAKKWFEHRKLSSFHTATNRPGRTTDIWPTSCDNMRLLRLFQWLDAPFYAVWTILAPQILYKLICNILVIEKKIVCDFNVLLNMDDISLKYSYYIIWFRRLIKLTISVKLKWATCNNSTAIVCEFT